MCPVLLTRTINQCEIRAISVNFSNIVIHDTPPKTETKISAKRENALIKIIAALSEALIGGLTGNLEDDSRKILENLELSYYDNLKKSTKTNLNDFKCEPPIKNRALQTYLKDARQLDYQFFDFNK
jgi:hypothetical protein